MKQFKIYENSTTKQIEAVKVGFAWWAFWLGGIWCLAKRLYLQGVLILVASIISGGIGGLIAAPLLGWQGNKLREINLTKNGFELKDTISAGNAEGVLAIYLSKQK